MNALERHVEWTAPATLWDHFNGSTSAAQRRVFRTPAILRFASDSFMEDFLALMKADGRQMSGLLAVPETWKAPSADVPLPERKEGLVGRLHAARTLAIRRLEARQLPMRTATWNASPNPTMVEKPLKLYQPAHQRYYLVTACLVCRTLGLPDRPLNTSAQERVSFVIRRLQPRTGATAINPDPTLCDELAFVKGQWMAVAQPDTLLEGEEQYPLSPLAYQELDGRRRRILNGLIPVAKRETLAGAPVASAPGGGTPPAPVDGRQMLLKMEVLGPWANLEDIAIRARDASKPATADKIPDGAVAATLARANEQIQTIAWYVLLDLSKWIEQHIPKLWDAINSSSPGGLSSPELTAYTALGGAALSSNGKTLRAALKQIRSFETMLETVKSPYRAETVAQWPLLAFQFVTATAGGPTGLMKAQREDIEAKLTAALPSGGVAAIPVRAVAQINAMDFVAPWFTVRCVFERPHCAALSPPVISDPTASFQLAAFFDSDAPARPIRIAMPSDTTPAGLRKFDKNAAFVMSDVMCGQFSAVRSLGFIDLVMAVLPWPLHQDLNVGDMKCPGGGGLACSLSLPIITICALIVLMIMVKLLDMIFFWMPFFQICLPVPKFDAKGSS
ncbi:MAG TPA: hypothetical protein VEL51_03580 [Vicinamibacterales bacterium]|nr:hypothetical protein [Vicinamibacterales bacterium]